MPPPTLMKEDRVLMNELHETFMAGCQGKYPQSASDVTYGIMAVMKMFEIRRAPLARELKYDQEQIPG